MVTMHRYLIWTNQLLLFMFIALIGHVVLGLLSARFDLQCSASSDASNVGEETAARSSPTWTHVGDVFLKVWPKASTGFPLFILYDMISPKYGVRPQERPSYRLLTLVWISFTITLCHKNIFHLPTTKQLINGALVCATLELIAKVLLYSYGSWFRDPEDQSQALEDGEKPTELDDGCTDPGKLEATLNRPWTWTIRNALSWKKCDAETDLQAREEEEVSWTASTRRGPLDGAITP